MWKLISVVALMWCSVQANAQIGLQLGHPTALGTGCPTPDSVAAILSPDNASLSVLFSAFQVDAGYTQNGFKQVDRKACSLAVPVLVPEGYQVSIIRTDYRGFNLVPAGGRNRINTEYFWAGIRGPRFTRDFMGPQNADFTTSNGVMVSSLVWSQCGADITLRVNTDIMTMTNRNGDQAMMTVDSADISSALIYSLQWRSCR